MVRQAHHDTVAETLTHSTVMLSLSKHDHARVFDTVKVRQAHHDKAHDHARVSGTVMVRQAHHDKVHDHARISGNVMVRQAHHDKVTV
jgi:hypothetical protein